MAKQKSTFEKRNREFKKQEKRKGKNARRSDRAQEKLENPKNENENEIDGDPDLAGIVPGPQPLKDDTL